MPTSETELVDMRAVEAEEARGQCYVCFEEGAPPSRCDCKDRFLHEACMVTLAEKSGKMNCTVCLKDYANLETRHTHRCTRRGVRVVVVILLWPWLLGIAIWRAEGWLSDPNQGGDNMHIGRAIETVFLLVFVVVLSICCCAEAVLYRSGHWRILAVKAHAVHV
jgi:hypothetical protein